MSNGLFRFDGGSDAIWRHRHEACDRDRGWLTQPPAAWARKYWRVGLRTAKKRIQKWFCVQARYRCRFRRPLP